MKIELKHLAPYLPYGLEILLVNHNGFSYKMDSSRIPNVDGTIRKPILRPLSDLTKQRIDIIYFGVIATDNDMYGTRDEFEDDLEIWLCDMAHIPLCVYNFLIMNHFDVFGLIEKGLAIDINTL